MNHYFQDIQGWFFHAKLFRDLIADLPDDAECVEVGSWKGKSAAFIGVEMIRQNRGMHLTCIDHFEGSNEDAHKKDEAVKQGRLFEEFQKNIAPLGLTVQGIKSDSLHAASLHPECSLDLIYIDAGHETEAVKADIAAWMPALKPGGIMVLDDYCWQTVKAAVDEVLEGFATVGNPPAVVYQKPNQ